MPSDCCVSSTSSRVNLLMLTKVTFCPHFSLHFCSFTAVIRAGHDQPGFSFDPFTRLIKDIGHVGEVTVSTVKPLPQHQFLLTGFSRHTLPRNLHSQRTTGFASAVSNFYEDGARTQLQHDTTVDVEIASQRTESSSSYVDGDLSDSDLNLGSRNNGEYPSEDERGYSSTRKHSP